MNETSVGIFQVLHLQSLVVLLEIIVAFILLNTLIETCLK
jgi:hypothetical protein